MWQRPPNTGPFFAFSSPFLSGVCTLLGFVAPQSRGWAVGCGRDALFETRRLPVRKKTAYRFVKKEDRSTTKMQNRKRTGDRIGLNRYPA